MTSGAYFFDVLPVHRRPQHLESLTSWLTRLADDNTISSRNQLGQLLDTYLVTQSLSPDIPPPDLSGLVRATHTPEALILATTLLPFAAKFGRTHDHQRISVFLKDDIAPYRRYCPLCLDEKGYSSLLWRFYRVPGCLEHGTRLLDRCPDCGQQMRLFSTPYHSRACHHCGADLTRAVAPSLTPADRQQMAQWTQDLTLLLMPADWDVAAVAQHLGPYWAALRRERGITPRAMAQLTGLNREKIKAIESPMTESARGHRFHHYVQYVQGLGVGLLDSMVTVANTLTHHPERYDWGPAQHYEQRLLDRLQQAQHDLEAQGIAPTQRTLAHAVGLGVPTLTYYPRLAAYLASFADADYRQSLREAREDQLLAQVQAAVAQLTLAGDPITQTAVGAIIDRAPEGFKLYPRVVDYLKQIIKTPEQRFHEREQQLLADVQQAIHYLETQGQRVSQEAVGNQVGMTPEGLKLYPHVRVIMEEVGKNYQHYLEQRPTQIIHMLEAAQARLHDAGELVTKEALAAEIQMAASSLNHFPAVKTRLQAMLAANKTRNAEITQQRRETALIAEIEQAEQTLLADGIPITRAAILDRISASQRTVSRYQRARELLNTLVKRYTA